MLQRQRVSRHHGQITPTVHAAETRFIPSKERKAHPDLWAFSSHRNLALSFNHFICLYSGNNPARLLFLQILFGILARTGQFAAMREKHELNLNWTISYQRHSRMAQNRRWGAVIASTGNVSKFLFRITAERKKHLITQHLYSSPNRCLSFTKSCFAPEYKGKFSFIDQSLEN